MNKITKPILSTTIGLLGSILAANAQNFQSQGTATTAVSATVQQQAANIQVSTGALSFSETLLLPAAGSGLLNYYATDDGGDGTGIGTVAWNATLGSTWQVQIYTSNSSDKPGLQSEINGLDEVLPLKYTEFTRGNLATDVSNGVAYDDVNIYSFVPDDGEGARIFAQSTANPDVVAGLDFRFATAIPETASGGTYSTLVTFDLLIDL